MYATKFNDSRNVSVAGMFLRDDSIINFEFLREELVMRDIILNRTDFKMA